MVTMENYNIINTYATILAAFGTISAVILSLYFSYFSRKISLKTSTGIFLDNQNNKYILIRILNNGNKTVTISEKLGLEFGLWRKKNLLIGFKYINQTQSSKFPCKLYEGEEAEIIIQINTPDDNFLETIYKNFLKNSPIININTLKLQIYPNLGNTIKIKIDKSIKDAIYESIA